MVEVAHLYSTNHATMKKAILTDIIAALFILLFVYAAVSKLIDYQKFRVQLGQSPMLTAFAGWVAWVVPAVEIIISLLLSIGKSRLVGLYASFGIMTLFTSYIVAITRFSDYIPCSCGGILSKMGWNQHLIFNIFFVLLAIAGIMIYNNHKKAIVSSKIIFS
jgi:uncharacterized membrane protein YphA (DoxX/SURF4 family)